MVTIEEGAWRLSSWASSPKLHKSHFKYFDPIWHLLVKSV